MKKFKVGDLAFFCQGKDVLDVGVVIEVTEAGKLCLARCILVKWQKLDKTKLHREDHIYTIEEV